MIKIQLWPRIGAGVLRGSEDSAGGRHGDEHCPGQVRVFAAAEEDGEGSGQEVPQDDLVADPVPCHSRGQVYSCTKTCILHLVELVFGKISDKL